MDSARLKTLAGILREDKLPIGLVFTLSDASNMRKAVDAILEAGMSVDLNFSMGNYYFNFKNEKLADEAHSLVSKVIDKSKEDWSE